MPDLRALFRSRPLSLCLLLALTGPVQALQEHHTDPRQEALWDLLEVWEAWGYSRGDPALLIGVVDSGFDFHHPDLKGQLQPAFYADGGYHTEVFENVAHGTMVSSILVARGDDGAGMSGLAPACKALTASLGTLEHELLRLRREFFTEHPNADMAAFQAHMAEHADTLRDFGQRWGNYQCKGAAAAIRHLTDRGARVINLSAFFVEQLVPAEAWIELQGAFAYAAEKDVVLVIGAGNNAQERADYPGDEQHTIVVGASNLDDTLWISEVEMQGQVIRQGSNFGSRLMVVAPAQDILVCMPHEERFYCSDDGPMGPTQVPFEGPWSVRPQGATSCATPVVAALAALIRSARPDLDAPAVIACITQGAEDLGEEGRDNRFGHGRVNYRQSLELALDWED